MASSAHIDSATRDPARTRERILRAALKEFAARGFAGARVDAIALRAAINKRMLYHYFGGKEGLFRAVLRRKISERQTQIEASSDGPADTLPDWFATNCKDADWIRLLEWEALQSAGKKVIDEDERCAAAARAVNRVRNQQQRGLVTTQFAAPELLLAMVSLTMFPVAFPQLTRMILGRAASAPAFRRRQAAFLKKFAAAFEPAQRRRKLAPGSKST